MIYLFSHWQDKGRVYIAVIHYVGTEAGDNIVRALGLVKVHLRDHIILTESEYFSMREANRLPFYDFQTGEMLRPY